MTEKGYGPAQLDKFSTNKDSIRGREQQLIENNDVAKSVVGISDIIRIGIFHNNPNRND
jgi:hypothetical protein